MRKPNVFSYMRISTKESADKQSFARQKKSLDAYADANNIRYKLNYKDYTTGNTFDREGWYDAKNIYGWSNSDDFWFRDLKLTDSGAIIEMNGIEIEVITGNKKTSIYFNNK